MYTSLHRAAYSRWNNFLLLKESSASKQAGVTVFLNAESSFTGDPHFSKVFVEESKRYGLFRWTFHLAVLWHFKVRPAFFSLYLLFHSLLPPFFFICAPRMNGPTSYNLRRAPPRGALNAAEISFGTPGVGRGARPWFDPGFDSPTRPLSTYCRIFPNCS